MTSSDPLLIRALRREETERTPVWLMRQAGRYLPEYRAVRKKAGGFLEMIRAPELAAEVTLQPIRRFGMDAAILFSDILIPLEAMGMPLEFGERGPRLSSPLRTAGAIDALRLVDPAEAMPYVGEALGICRRELPDEVALLGFCGAPFTLACYAVEGGSSTQYNATRGLFFGEPKMFEQLMEKLAEMVGRHLLFQVENGAQAVVLFDTWAGLLSREDYVERALPYVRQALEAVRGRVPRIFFATGVTHLLDDLATCGAEGMGVDHRVDIGEAFDRFGDRLALQGNLDPAVLLSSPTEVAARTRTILERVAGRRGHVLNLGHGVLKETDPECVAAFVETAATVRA